MIILHLKHILINQKIKLTFSTTIKKKLKIKNHSTKIHFIFQ